MLEGQEVGLRSNPGEGAFRLSPNQLFDATSIAPPPAGGPLK